MPRRSQQRFSTVFNAGYGACNSAMLFPCRIVDISWGGSRLELFSHHAVNVGSTIELHIEVPGLSRRIVALFRCLWDRSIIRSNNEEGHLIGGCFPDMCPEDRTLLLDHAKKQQAAQSKNKQKPRTEYATTSRHYS
jgi:hypothetical protein